MLKEYTVYIMTNKNKTLYIGFTNDLARRISEHKGKFVRSFTNKYNCDILVYYELVSGLEAAKYRERQIKGWLRAKKINLIMSMNPEWKDLSLEWVQ